MQCSISKCSAVQLNTGQCSAGQCSFIAKCQTVPYQCLGSPALATSLHQHCRVLPVRQRNQRQRLQSALNCIRLFHCQGYGELPRCDCFADSTPLGFNTALQGAAHLGRLTGLACKSFYLGLSPWESQGRDPTLVIGH